MNDDETLILERVGFRVVRMTYCQMRRIMAEVTGTSDTQLLRALKAGHGIEFDAVAKPNTVIFFVIDSRTRKELNAAGVSNPTWAQLIGTSVAFALTEADAVKRFRKVMGADDE